MHWVHDKQARASLLPEDRSRCSAVPHRTRVSLSSYFLLEFLLLWVSLSLCALALEVASLYCLISLNIFPATSSARLRMGLDSKTNLGDVLLELYEYYKAAGACLLTETYMWLNWGQVMRKNLSSDQATKRPSLIAWYTFLRELMMEADVSLWNISSNKKIM